MGTSLGEVIRCDFNKYSNVKRWLDNLKKLKSWPQVNTASSRCLQYYDEVK